MKFFLLFSCFSVTIFLSPSQSSRQNKASVIAYYAGDAKSIDAYGIEKLTHIIFSFCHLKGNQLSVDNKKDSLTIQHLVFLKKRNPSLKVLLSLGGWGGCETCSSVFSTEQGRSEFAQSVKTLNDFFHTDGIDLDWEYPAISGFPGHRYVPEDKHNFTLLVKALRQTLGNKHEITFAAGGFTKFLAESIEWNAISPLIDKINLMTYDLVHGFSTVTGHHTPLYSTPEQIESTDYAVRYLDSIGVPRSKMVIGAAFYARIFDVEEDKNKGLYQKGKFNKGISYSSFNKDSLEKQGFVYYWDDVAKAPYLYSSVKKQLITMDDERSIRLKTKYVLEQKLNGIMFWELGNDKRTNGLLDAIDKEVRLSRDR